MSLNAFILQLENNYFLYPIYQFISQFLFYVVSKQSGKIFYLLYLPLSLLSFLGTLSKLVTHTSLDRKSKSDGRQYTKIMQAVSQCLNSTLHTYCCNSYSVAVHLVNRIQGLYNILQHILMALTFQRWSVMRQPFSVFF